MGVARLKLQDDIPLTIYFEIGNTKKKIEDRFILRKVHCIVLKIQRKIRCVLCLRMKRLEPKDFDEEWKNVR